MVLPPQPPQLLPLLSRQAFPLPRVDRALLDPLAQRLDGDAQMLGAGPQRLCERILEHGRAGGDVPDDRSRHQLGRHVLYGRRTVRPRASPQPERVRRHFWQDAVLHGDGHFDFLRWSRFAGPVRLYWRSVRRARRLEVQLPAEFAHYVASKGSIAIDGISLTVAEVLPKSFVVWIIPYTKRHTNLDRAQAGDLLNIEFDILAKYVERMLSRSASNPNH